MTICISVAELTVQINYVHFKADVFCADYCVPPALPDIVTSVSEQFLDGYIKKAAAKGIAISKPELETTETYRQIAERLPGYDRIVCHGAAITYKGAGLIFIAPPGTGKTTHIRQWTDCFKSDVEIVNGDKPILKIDADGVTMFGTPWSGKEKKHKNTAAPVRAVCLLRRGEKNRIFKANPGDYIEEVLAQMYLPYDEAAYDKTVSLIDKMFGNIDFYVLECTPQREAALVARACVFKEENF